MLSRLQRTLLPLAAAVVAAAAPAAADWLVTRDGAKIETRGPWKVEGRRIVFTAPNGTLSAVRADEIDLDRSAAETELAKIARTAPPPEPEKREPVLRLTEKDFPPVQLAPEGEKAAEAPTAEKSPLEVIAWERTENPAGDGIEIFGTIRNNGVNAVTSPTMILSAYDEDGGLLATAEGTINAGAIPVGRTANFRAAFPGLLDFTEVRFDVRGNVYATSAPTTAGEEDEEGVPYEEPVAPLVDEAPPSDEGAAPEASSPPS